MLAAGTDEFSAVADESYLGKAALAGNTDWTSFLGGSNDDAQVNIKLSSLSMSFLTSFQLCLK